MSPAQKYITNCRNCQQTYTASAVEIPIIGQPPSARLVKFVTALGEHMATAHPEKIKALQRDVESFTGLLIMSEFETRDPGLSKHIDRTRSAIHQRTRVHFVTNEAIAMLISRLNLSDEHAATVTALVQELRDAYEEQGNWTPDNQAEKALILV